MNDNQIISLFENRDETAISELNTKYGQLCGYLAMNILHNASDTEECVNDTWLGVWNSIPPKKPESLIGYVCKLARNIALKRFRYNTAEKRNSSYDVALEELEGVLVSEKDVESEIDSALLTEAIESFLDSLEKVDRVIFMERYYFSAPYSAIAAKCGLTEKNVSVKLVRIRKKLREHLRERDFIV